MARQRSFRGEYKPDMPAMIKETVSVTLTTTDYTPSNGGLFRMINCSVAGVLKIRDIMGNDVVEQVVVGWNLTGGQKIVGDNGNTATVKCVALEV